MPESSRFTKLLGLSFLVLMTGTLLLLGCAGTSEPSSPGILAGQDNPAESAGRNLWGIWHVSLDPSTMTADVTPLRGAQFTCNVTQFMQPPMSPVHMVQIAVDPSSTPATGYFSVDVTLKHPFPGLNQYRGFDVRGIMMADGSVSGLHDSTVLRAGITDSHLLNPDGYTRWWNYPEFTTYNTIFGFTHGKLAPPNHPTSTINPYKLFSGELGSLDPVSAINPDSRATFSTQPGVNTRRYDIQFKMDGLKVVLDFDYAVDASWSEPDSAYKPDYPEAAFSLAANCNEAFMVSVSDAGSTAYYATGSDKGGEFKLDIEVFDHQAVASPNGMADEVAAIWVEGEVLTSPVDVLPTATILPGSGTQSSVYEVTLGDLNIYNPGETELFLTIESKNITTYEPQVPGGSAFNFPDAPLAAYLTYTAEIANHSLLPAPIVTSVVPNTGDANKIINDVEVHGLNFINGAVVKFQHADTVFAIGPLPAAFIDSTLLTLDLNLAGAPPGFYNVTVTNPDTKFGTLDNGFEVTNSMWWQSYMYNAQNIGWNPTANLPDPSALQQKWVTSIGGFKFTTPVVADGKIFFSTNNSYWEYPDMAIHCVDLNTGVELWSKLINPTSASTGARVFSCPVWWHGPDGIDRVAVGGDQVYCFNADTGDLLWSFDDTYGGGNIGWWSNQLHEYDGKVLARSRYQPLYVLDFQTGAMLQLIVTSNSSEGGCGAADGKVYINSSYNVDCADINTGAILWSTVLPGSGTNMNHWVDPCIVGNRLYVTTYQSICFCISIDGSSGYPPGQVIWSWSDPTMPAMSATMYAGAGARESGGVTRLYIASASGASNTYVYCVEDQGTGASMVWRSAQAGSFEGGAIWSSAPSYPEGVVYCPEVYSGVLYAFDASNGSVVWSYPAGGITAKCGVSLVNNQLVLCSNADVRVFKAP